MNMQIFDFERKSIFKMSEESSVYSRKVYKFLLYNIKKQHTLVISNGWIQLLTSNCNSLTQYSIILHVQLYYTYKHLQYTLASKHIVYFCLILNLRVQ